MITANSKTKILEYSNSDLQALQNYTQVCDFLKQNSNYFLQILCFARYLIIPNHYFYINFIYFNLNLYL